MSHRAASMIAFAGALGAVARWSLLGLVDDAHSWPIATLGANLSGCLVLGGLTGWFRARLLDDAVLAATVGFCGALTTYSGFAVDIGELARAGRWGTVTAYITTSVVGGTALFVGGVRAGARARGRGAAA